MARERAPVPVAFHDNGRPSRHPGNDKGTNDRVPRGVIELPLHGRGDRAQHECRNRCGTDLSRRRARSEEVGIAGVLSADLVRTRRGIADRTGGFAARERLTRTRADRLTIVQELDRARRLQRPRACGRGRDHGRVGRTVANRERSRGDERGRARSRPTVSVAAAPDEPFKIEPVVGVDAALAERSRRRTTLSMRRSRSGRSARAPGLRRPEISRASRFQMSHSPAAPCPTT